MSFDSYLYYEIQRSKGQPAALDYLRTFASTEVINFRGWQSSEAIENVEFARGISFAETTIRAPIRILNCSSPSISFHNNCVLQSEILIELSNPRTELTFSNCVFDGASLSISGNKSEVVLRVNHLNYQGNGLKYLTLSNLKITNDFFALRCNGGRKATDCFVSGPVTLETFHNQAPMECDVSRTVFKDAVTLFAKPLKCLKMKKAEFKGGLIVSLITSDDPNDELSDFYASKVSFDCSGNANRLQLSLVVVDENISFKKISAKVLIIKRVTANNIIFFESAQIDFLQLENGRPDSVVFWENSKLSNVLIRNMVDPFGLTMHRVECKRRFALENVDLNYLGAHGAVFKSTTVFQGVTFGKAPEFFEAELFSDTSFRDCTFIEKSGDSEGAYRALKHLMLSRNNWVEEQRFTSLELHSNWKSKNKEYAAKVIGWFYHQTNRFGASIGRPFFVLFFYCFLVGMIIYCRPDAVYFDYQPKLEVADKSWRAEVNGWDYFAKGAAFSLVNSLGPLKLHPSLQVFQAGSSWVLVFSSLQSIFSTYLWFLIFAWIKRRFRTH